MLAGEQDSRTIAACKQYSNTQTYLNKHQPIHHESNLRKQAATGLSLRQEGVVRPFRFTRYNECAVHGPNPSAHSVDLQPQQKGGTDLEA